MSKRTTARQQRAKQEEESRPDIEFRARSFHVRVGKIPWKVITMLATAAVTKLAISHFSLL
ncbi:hypothetical protein AB0L71_28540 [Streptomyces sp. NPDC052052]|uniref:hypothetical protein n=1 Tax=Streptomyces sp. NPDC052052 TaxID=3154756 RepID=UPI0034170AA8